MKVFSGIFTQTLNLGAIRKYNNIFWDPDELEEERFFFVLSEKPGSWWGSWPQSSCLNIPGVHQAPYTAGRNFTHKDPEYRAGDQDNTNVKRMWRRMKEPRGWNCLWSTSMISGKWEVMDSQPKKRDIHSNFFFSWQTWQNGFDPPISWHENWHQTKKRNSCWGRELQVAISPIAKNDWVRLYGFWISGSTTLPSLRYHSFQVPILDFCLFLFCSLQL